MKTNVIFHFDGVYFTDKPTSVTLKSNATDVNKVAVNATLMFTCSSNARPTASYRFYRNGNMEQNSSANTWMTPILTCPTTSAGENFTCVAYNKAGDTSKSQSFMLFGK